MSARLRLSARRRRPRIAGPASAVAACLLVVMGLAAATPGSADASAMAGASATASAGPVPPVPAGYTQVFLDNFGGAKGSAPSSQNWLYDIGTNWGNNQVEQDTNSTSNVYLDGQGDLIIQANESNGTWTSGRIETTRDDFAAPAGGELEMTASVQQPNVANALGYWPAFWALGSPMRSGGTWPTSGELDMFEDVNGMNEASQNFHDANNQFGHPQIACPSTPCDSGYNTYTVIINRTNTKAESLQLLIDGHVEETVTEAQAGTVPWQEAIDHGFYLILDLAMGGSAPNYVCGCTSPTAATTSGGQLKVAYVAAYERAPAGR